MHFARCLIVTASINENICLRKSLGSLRGASRPVVLASSSSEGSSRGLPDMNRWGWGLGDDGSTDPCGTAPLCPVEPPAGGPVGYTSTWLLVTPAKVVIPDAGDGGYERLPLLVAAIVGNSLFDPHGRCQLWVSHLVSRPRMELRAGGQGFTIGIG